MVRPVRRRIQQLYNIPRGKAVGKGIYIYSHFAIVLRVRYERIQEQSLEKI